MGISLMKMNRTTLLGLASALLMTLAPQPGQAQGNPVAVMDTSMGQIKIELLREKAPGSVENFINYANSGFYDGTIFHRVISHFMIQGGGFTPDMQKKTTGDPIPNEAANGVSNTRGTVAMARTNHPHSATAQFFINVQDNPNLDYRGESSGSSWGYAVFGRVTEGMDVVDEIRFVPTETRPPFSDVPAEPVIIEKVTVSGG
jgi:cyclophilin family peptidyl-prolyl cis-trans isomerase